MDTRQPHCRHPLAAKTTIIHYLYQIRRHRSTQTPPRSRVKTPGAGVFSREPCISLQAFLGGKRRQTPFSVYWVCYDLSNRK